MTQPSINPDLILLNGNVRTMDDDHPQAQAIAISSGSIMAVGDNDAIVAMAGAFNQANQPGRTAGTSRYDRCPFSLL